MHIAVTANSTITLSEFCCESLDTNADIIAKEQRLACVPDACVPGVKVVERDAVLAGDGSARVARHDLVEPLAVGVYTWLDGGGRRDLAVGFSQYY